jgi:hypothetical protein
MTRRPRQLRGLPGPAWPANNGQLARSMSGVGKTSLPGRVQPIDSSGGRKAGFDVGATSDFRARAIEQLAKHLAAAYLAYAMDLNFPEAMRYVLRQSRAGDLWTVAARFIFGAKSLIDRAYGR